MIDQHLALGACAPRPTTPNRPTCTGPPPPKAPPRPPPPPGASGQQSVGGQLASKPEESPPAPPPGGRGGLCKGGLGWVGSRPHLDPWGHGHRPSLCLSTGPAGSRLSGHKAYRTDDRPHTPRWHMREGDAAVPVCLRRTRCLCLLGMCWWGSEARRVTQLRRAWPAPVPLAWLGGGVRAVAAVLGLWGGQLAWSNLYLPCTSTTRGRHGGLAGYYCVFSAGMRTHRWATPAVMCTHSAPQAYSVIGRGSARVLSPWGHRREQGRGGGGYIS